MSATAPLTCRQLVELVTAYLDGALSASDRTRFDDHIRRCRHCRAYLAQVRETVALTGQLREKDVPPAMREALLAAFRSWKTAS